MKPTKKIRRAWFTYILECADGTLYSGASNNVSARVVAHNAGKGAKYTRARLPVRLAYKQKFATKGAALSAEASLKKLTRVEKITLVKKKPSR